MRALVPLLCLPLWLAGCPQGEEPSTTDEGTPPPPSGDYDVLLRTEPDPAVAGEETEVWLEVVGPDGLPVDDLQLSHERAIHTFLISQDLSSFVHLHHEDFYELTADDLRSSTFHFPYTFPLAGDFVAWFEFANQNVFRIDSDRLTVEGEPAQAASPQLDLVPSVTIGDVTAELVWDVGPTAGAESAFHLYLTTAAGEVTDLVPWLAADGHGAVVNRDLSAITHVHAWVPGMEQMSPGMIMPHMYDGPDLPFKVVIEDSGPHKMWIQFARAAAPDEPYTIPIPFDVP